MISTDSLMQIAISVLAFIVAISVLVAVHEFGHFWVARRLGIRVLRFSIGFGKPLWQRTMGKDPVEYVIASIPLGGYVKLLDEREAPIPEHEAVRAFNRQPVWKRIAVLLAGPAFNMIFAVLAYWLLFSTGVTAMKPVIGEVEPESIAARAGLKYEDLIVSVGNRPVETLETAALVMFEDLIDDGSAALRLQAVDGSQRDIVLRANEPAGAVDPETLFPSLGFEFWRPRVTAAIASVVEESAADHAGLKAGDRILKFDGRDVGDFTQLVRMVQPNAKQTVTLQIERDGAVMDVPITIGEQESGNKSVGFIGVAPTNEMIESGRTREDVLTLQKFAPIAALDRATAKTWDDSVMILQFIRRVFTAHVSIKAFGGPLAIAEISGVAAQQGWQTFLGLLALISINLGVFNLLPIPMLDGGQIVYQLAELIKGRPVSERAQMLGQQIGIALLILLMSVVFYYDIARQLN